MSCAPDLVEDEKEHDGYAAPDKDDYLFSVMSDDRHIVLDVWIGIEKLMSSAPDKNPDKEKEDHGESESDAQRRNCLPFNHRRHQQITDVHSPTVSTRFIGCYDASVGFSSATQDRIVATSLERDHRAKRLGTSSFEEQIQQSRVISRGAWLGALGGEDRFRIRAGDFADSDPTDSANE